MKGERLARILGQVDETYIMEAEHLINEKENKKEKRKVSVWKRFTWYGAAAAALALCLLAGGIALLAPSSAAVTVWSSEGEEITSAGAVFTTGTVTDSGTLIGHPLMFHLSGKGIETVRFSCKNGLLNFTDLTELRSEFGAAQNFTVPYGRNESEYDFLTLDWVPDGTLAALRSGEYGSVAALPAELREDVIVMEIAFWNGRTAVKALRAALTDDGSFQAVLEDYQITGADEFVKRPDSEPIDRETLYGKGIVTVAFLDADGRRLEPDAGWFDMKDAETVEVRWTGRCAVGAQLFLTPTGTETYEYMKLVDTRIVRSAENLVVFPADKLHEELMCHLDVLIDLGGGCYIRSDLYNVFYESEF